MWGGREAEARSQDFLGQGEEFAELGFESVEAAEAFADEGGIGAGGGMGGGGEVLHFVDLAGGGFEPWFKEDVDEVFEDGAEIGVGLVVVAAVTADPDLFDSAPGFELADAHAGVAFADLEGVHEVVERHGAGVEVEDGVNLAEGAGEAEALGGTPAEVDEALADGGVRIVQNDLNDSLSALVGQGQRTGRNGGQAGRDSGEAAGVGRVWGVWGVFDFSGMGAGRMVCG